MSVINRRNAILGWCTWQVAKRAGKKKARAAIPGKGDYAGLNKPAIASIGAAAGAAAGGALWIWRKKSDQPASEVSSDTSNVSA
jgi:hypothetical protein